MKEKNSKQISACSYVGCHPGQRRWVVGGGGGGFSNKQAKLNTL